ncbi:MAG: SDR family oxidoreductase [Deltaproteobacteria bacterium]|nr:SDR family oxidoreductase [Deltaproteobacteria bacterium]
MRFRNKVVVVTGASSGIGAATAHAFAKEGAILAITGRDRIRTQEIGDKLKAAYVGVGDISISEYCTDFIKKAVEVCGKIDVLVNCAGKIIRQDTISTTDEQWLDIMAININAVFFMSREALKVMKEHRQGAIVNVSSIAGLVGGKGLTAYCTSKGAIIQMTQSMALDYATDGIRINAICPGETDTPMLFSGHAKRPTRQELEEMKIPSIPMKRLARPEEIARAVLFLASDDASYITGTFLTVDGGSTAQ